MKETLDLVVLKKAFAQITFSQFHLFKFFEALDSFVDEIEIEITENEIKIITSDPSRIGLMEIIFGNKSYQFYRAGKVGVNYILYIFLSFIKKIVEYENLKLFICF